MRRQPRRLAGTDQLRRAIDGVRGARLVLLVGCEERLLPTGYAIDSGEALRVEEERRLFYVGATRAKERLTLTTAAERLGASTMGPSRFLAESGL